MKIEKIIIYKKHVLLDREEVILVDTGSPASFHTNGVYEFGGKQINCSTSIMGVDSDYISKQLNRPIMGLIGMDTLSQFGNVIFDYANNQLLLDVDVKEENLTELISNNIMNVPCIDLMVGSRVARMFVDTGAPVSYISNKFTNGCRILGNVEDFHPLFGEFTSSTYTLPVNVKNQDIEMTFGNLPSLFQQAIGLVGVDGIIGYELFSRSKIMLRNSTFFLVD